MGFVRRERLGHSTSGVGTNSKCRNVCDTARLLRDKRTSRGRPSNVMAYSANSANLYRRAAGYVAKLLKGSNTKSQQSPAMRGLAGPREEQM
jgi:hypothetical protein